MTSNAASKFEIEVEDIEYLRHADKPLLARIYKPRGAGPFPLVINLHGGAWINKDRLADVAGAYGRAHQPVHQVQRVDDHHLVGTTQRAA